VVTLFDDAGVIRGVATKRQPDPCDPSSPVVSDVQCCPAQVGTHDTRLELFE
jgi:hypothetical protein